jgi:tRNA(fMet)-specific endonuclease VapC
MGVVLLDTSVASLLHPKKKGSDLREKYAPHMNSQTLALSFQTVAELWSWAEANKWEEKSRQGLDAFIRRFLVIPYDFVLAQVWAKVMEASKMEGRRFESGDCWIAATAVHRGIPLLVHDKDFLGRSIPGLEIITYYELKEQRHHE